MRSRGPNHRVMWISGALAAFLCASCPGGSAGRHDNPAESGNGEITLRDWTLHSSDGMAEDGATISRVGYDPLGWLPATLPSTVLAALVAAGVYPDPLYGMNLHELPGTLPVGLDVSLFPMPQESPFRPAWWHRTEFRAPAIPREGRAWLRFEGVNFRADIWLNGRLIADRTKIAGTFREYELDVTDAVHAGGANALAVEVVAPLVHDLAYNWVDWNPGPPDKNMGIYRDVKLLVTGPVAVRHPVVASQLELPSMRNALLTVSAEVENAGSQPVTGLLRGRIEGSEFAQAVSLAAGERRRVKLSPGDHPELAIANPRVWWPRNLGEQNLYSIELDFLIGAQVSDRRTSTFGIRDMKAPLTEEGYRTFEVNGRRILIRGGAWAPDLLLRHSSDRMESEIRYAADLGINMIRLEGKPEVDEFYDLCDRYGILVMPGWCCCDHWQFCDTWNDEDYTVAAESLRNQIHHLANHPSVAVWLNGSDDPPSPKVERMYIDILNEEGWPMPYLSSADDQVSEVTGPTGVKMVGPYEYVPPEYWLTDTRFGGAFGFNTETNPGEVIPPMESLARFLPPDHLWPIDKFWIYHAGRGYYLTLYPFNQAMERRYGAAENVEDYIRKAQVLDYDNHRAMFEAYGRNKYHSTGVIQFLMNSAWPSFIWNLYDYYLHPAGAYFGAKKAMEMLHVQYSYDDRSIVVVNGYSDGFPSLRVSAKVHDFDLTEKFRRDENVAVAADGVVRVFELPEIPGISKTYFLVLALTDEAGAVLSRNFYWLSTRPVILDWDRTRDERLTPVLQEADMTLLDALPTTTLGARMEPEPDDEPGWETRRIHLENTGVPMAFFVQLRLVEGIAGADVAPVLWEENDFPLFPGENREISVRFRTADLHGSGAAVEVRGWNVPPFVIE